MLSREILQAARTFLTDHGFNIAEPALVENLDSRNKSVGHIRTHYANMRSLIFVANGGSILWEQFSKWRIQQKPDLQHPLDTYTKTTLEALKTLLLEKNIGVETIFPFYQEKVWFNFQNLAEGLNITRASPLGLHLHPTYGPWLSFRGLLLLDQPWEKGIVANTVENFDPCPTCNKPCISTCPAQALTVKGADITKCYTYRLSPASPCVDRCLAREACPVGKEHQFPREAIAFHYRLTK